MPASLFSAMKPSVRSLLPGAIAAIFFALTLGVFAQEKSAPATPAPAPTPATEATPPTPAPTPPPAAVPVEATPAPAAPETPAETAPTTRRLDEAPVQVEKPAELPASNKDKSKKKSRGQQIRERAEAVRQRIEERDAARTGDDIVNVFADSHLPAGEKSDAVVAVFGSSTVEGEVTDNVVSIFGNTRVTGPGVRGEAVTIFGSAYINAPVSGEVVVVFGDLEIGPDAKLDGDVVCIAGTVKRSPQAILKNSVKNIGSAKLDGLNAWFELCLRKVRPLAFSGRLGWAWGIAFAFLGLYVFSAVVFRSGAEKCLKVLETSPGFSVLAALLTALILPVLSVLLVMTGVGIAALPFIGLGALCATLFGKMVVIAWLGRRFTRFFGDGPLGHIAFAVLVGGLIMMALYTIPLFGFILFKFIGWLGLGVVIYTLAQGVKRAKPVMAAPAAAYAAPMAPPPVVPVSPEPVVPGSVPPSDVPLTSSGFVGAAAMPAAPSPEPMATGAVPIDPGFVPPPIQPAPFAPPLQPLPLPRAMPIISASTLPRAGFWIRLGAMAIDTLMFVLIVGGFLNGGPVMIPALAAYAAAMWKFKGTTIGGVICGLKVVRLDDRPLDWPTSIVRAMGCFLSMAAMGFGFIWVAFDRDRQSWHDKIAGTTVVLMPKGVSLL